jgi:hypothetical protein
VFDRAFSGVELDWDLPDLAPPGFPKPKARAQSQAEFRSPGAYFSEKRLQGLAASGRSLMKKHAGCLAPDRGALRCSGRHHRRGLGP